jgi:hypothetical protein
MLCAWGVQEWRIYFAEGSSNGITRQFQRYVSVEAMCNRYLLCVSLLQAHSSACMSFMTLATVCVCPSSNGYLDEHANLLIDGGCHRMDVRPDVWGLGESKPGVVTRSHCASRPFGASTWSQTQ